MPEIKLYLSSCQGRLSRLHKHEKQQISEKKNVQETLVRGVKRGYTSKTCGCNSAVECFLAKEDVVSSNLIARSAKLWFSQSF